MPCSRLPLYWKNNFAASYLMWARTTRPSSPPSHMAQAHTNSEILYLFWIGPSRFTDSMNRESIQNPNFQVNHESTIRQNWRNLLLKESIHESRIGLKSLLFSESWIDDSQKLLNRDGPNSEFKITAKFCWHLWLVWINLNLHLLGTNVGMLDIVLRNLSSKSESRT